MTAEIAILNRTAVALAADSIVTLSGPSGSKTYDSAEKIFELSRFRPIGLMVYNYPELFGIPIEILAREFREDLSDEFSHLFQVWPWFENQLLSLFQESEFDDTITQFEALLTAELEHLKMTFLNFAMNRLEDGQQSTLKELEKRLIEMIDSAIKEADSNRLPGFMEKVNQQEFVEKFGQTTHRLVQKILLNLVQSITGKEIPKSYWKKFDRLAFALVRSNRRSPAFTGLVFAGFGRHDRFASLQSVEIDGTYFGELRVIVKKEVDIDRCGPTAVIVPIAQKDMSERFIFGIDQQFENKLRSIAEDLTTQLLGQAKNLNESQRQEIKVAAIERFAESISMLKERAESELQSIVNHLSKKELGEVAYSLVELTSRKRRYSSGLDTVGGPIDVAILTRNEGFIWVKRKRYFDTDLNPAYIERLKKTIEIEKRERLPKL